MAPQHVLHLQHVGTAPHGPVVRRPDRRPAGGGARSGRAASGPRRALIALGVGAGRVALAVALAVTLAAVGRHLLGRPVVLGRHRVRTTLGRALADLVAGRDPWPAAARGVAPLVVCTLVLCAALAAVVVLTAVVLTAVVLTAVVLTAVGSAAGRRRPDPAVTGPRRLASIGVTAPADRRDRLRTRLRREGLDALLVTDLINLRYLTGFTGSNGALLLTAQGGDEAGTVFCTDGRYLTQSAAQVPDLERVIDRPVDTGLLTRATAGRIGFEARAVTVAQHGTLTAALAESVRGVELVATTDLVEELRVIKDDGEIEALRLACATADQALADLLAAGGLRPGRTEREVGLDLDQRMRELGASGPAFETIVAAGANGAVPHHRPDTTVLAAGDLVTLDFGAVVDGYHSDMTRTLALGTVADWQRELYELVARSQEAGRAAVRPGAGGAEVDAVARRVIAAAGQGEWFLHGLGHGVGLQVHEAPSLAASATGTMSSGMCVTVEPGVYLAGRGGVRIEDSGVVRPDGYEVLTTTSRELIAV